jgi:hypothetical protein
MEEIARREGVDDSLWESHGESAWLRCCPADPPLLQILLHNIPHLRKRVIDLRIAGQESH